MRPIKAIKKNHPKSDLRAGDLQQSEIDQSLVPRLYKKENSKELRSAAAENLASVDSDKSEENVSEDSKSGVSSEEKDYPVEGKNPKETGKSSKRRGMDKIEEAKQKARPGKGVLKRPLEPMEDIVIVQKPKRCKQEENEDSKMDNSIPRRSLAPAATTTDYEDIHKNGLLYIDKTEQLYKMIMDKNCLWQLARPRRFGKTLMLSTIKYIFEGRKDLFNGCWIHNNAPHYFWEKVTRPVLSITMPMVNNKLDVSAYDERVRDTIIDELQISFDIELPDKPKSHILSYAITTLYKKKKAPIALLIDEYDRAFIHQSNQPKERQEEFRNYLIDLYAPIKDLVSNKRLSFSLLVGISSVGLGEDSTSNNFKNITLEKDYNDIVGITEDEIDQKKEIQDSMKRIAKAKKSFYYIELGKIKDYYNGFQFHPEGKKLINTNAFMRYLERNGEISSYFVDTKTTLLKDCLNYSLSDLNDLLVGEMIINPKKLILSDNGPIPCLFFSGYLTIHSDAGQGDWKLRFTNNEVRSDYINKWIESKKMIKFVPGLIILARNEQYADYLKALNENFKKIPADITNKYEFQAAMYAIYLIDSAQALHLELKTEGGRLDMKTEDDKFINIIEYKYQKSAEDAINQILQNEYYNDYLKDAMTLGKVIRLFGINYNPSTRSISGIIVMKQVKARGNNRFTQIYKYTKPLQFANSYLQFSGKCSCLSIKSQFKLNRLIDFT
eukprot:TRINITY_DN2864_c0_g1_i1.p1 TRINITY_DN2864_c0_g1~~TRINITY_DN2864_c0_g1_i1.p1  ORF type:complete len:723 (+),score=71.65 TRINITY_DN2864_c0_g1_i1:211-2379(+)